MKTGNLSLDQAPPEDIPFRFFLSAPLFGILAGLLISLKGLEIFSTTWSPATIALAHLLVLGRLAFVMLGALYQMIPVLVGGSVPWLSLARPLHGGLVAGVLSLVGGFIFAWSHLLLIGAFLLFFALAIFIIQICAAVFRNVGHTPAVLAIRISIISLALTIILGLFMAGAFAGFWTNPFNRVALKSIHLVLGLGGWVSPLIMGIAFPVLSMFYLAPIAPARRVRSLIYFTALAMALYCLILALEPDFIPAPLGLIPPGLALSFFSFETFRLLRNRKRKITDSTLRFWQYGLVCLPFVPLPVAAYPWTGDDTVFFLAGIFFLFGFALPVTAGMLYKIVPFLVWFHRFSSLLGQPNVPLLKDILPDSLARLDFYFSLAAFLLLAAGIIFQTNYLIRPGGIAFIFASALLFKNMVRAIYIKRPPDP